MVLVIGLYVWRGARFQATLSAYRTGIKLVWVAATNLFVGGLDQGDNVDQGVTQSKERHGQTTLSVPPSSRGSGAQEIGMVSPDFPIYSIY